MVELLVAGVTAVVVGNVAYGFGLSRGRRQARIIPVAKKVDNRVMPDLSRAERRAHKRRPR